MVSKFTDQQYLKTDQYKDSSNLDARVAIHQRFSTNPYCWFRWIFDTLLKLPSSARILELGCGHGLLWKENVDRIPSGWMITLSDLSPGMLDAAWRNLVVSGRAFQFKEIDAQSIPIQDETFDAVIANHMLYHVPDRSKALMEIKRVLKLGGHIFATTVGKQHMKEMNAWLERVSQGSYVSKATIAFTLENGLEQIQPYFSNVSASRYADQLRVTELAPLIDYIHSMVSLADLQQEELRQLKRELETELNRNGEIFITKDSGLFEAIK
ncbi:MAG TPA: methyltransferase domain-containing protein [Anaerolineales bacterium]|nr:methyltransferase domain-containing protein [Anaerolineales bacterium]